MDMMGIRRAVILGQRTSLLPPIYQQVEYIEASGTQYLLTNYVPQGTNLTIEWTFVFSQRQSGDMMQFGTTVTGGVVQAEYYNHRTWYGGNNSARYSAAMAYATGDLNTVYTAKMTNSSWTIGDSSASPTSTYANTVTLPLAIFARNSANGIQYKTAGLQLYSLTFTEGDTVAANFMPCYRIEDGEIGMYDTVSQTFYTNAGTGTFSKGADV